MTRKLQIETREGTKEINYELLSIDELMSRISAYQVKYGWPLIQYNRHLNCDLIGPGEMTDIMDWECLEAEVATRQKLLYMNK